MAEPGSEWDSFVSNEPDATLAHASEWARVMREAYGVEPHYMAVRSEGSLAAVLPLVRVPTLRGGAELVSMPYLDSGGVLGSDPEAEGRLLCPWRCHDLLGDRCRIAVPGQAGDRGDGAEAGDILG